MWGKPTYDDLERQVADLTQAVEVKEIAYQNTKASVAELTAKVQQLELGEILSANRVREAEAKVADLTAKLEAQNAEIRDMRKSIDTAAKGIVRLTTERDDLTAKLAAGRQWTNEQPRTPGWYWWKWRPDVCPDVHYVSEQDIAEGNPPGLWCGPLEAPR